MEFPVEAVVNTSADTLVGLNRRSSDAAPTRGGPGLLTINIQRKAANEGWGFRLQGGKDRRLPFQIVKVPLDSLAGRAGCQSNDYLVKINGQSVFELDHNDAINLIKQAGNNLTLVIERGDHIVPSMNEAFPQLAKKKDDEFPKKEKPYYQRQLEETGELPGQKGRGFTTIGKPRMATKQYNSPLKMYGDEALEEIMQQGTLMGKEVDISNPWNVTGKQFDVAKSGVLSSIVDGDDQDKHVKNTF